MAGDAFWEFERDGWNRAAEHYEAMWLDDTRLFVPALLDAAGVASGTRLLDLASGPGMVSGAAADRGARPVGIDVAEAMVRHARTRFPGLEFVVGDAQQLPFADGSFDAVTASFGVLHFSRPDAAFAEARRVLVSGRRFAFTTWASQGNSVDDIVSAAVAAHALPVELPQGPDYFRYADPDLARGELVAAGFDRGSFDAAHVDAVWSLPRADQLFEAELHAGVRTGAVLRAQPPDRLAAIREAVTAAVEGYADGDGYALPVAALVVSAAV